MILDEDSYVERIAYRLKKWADVLEEEEERHGAGKGIPHKS